MSEIVFENVTFRYPETEQDVFHGFNISLPRGIISLMGQNGTGKSTFLLLAGGTMLPSDGKVLIKERDTAVLRDARARQEYVSFVFQNMEFETEDTIGELLPFVYEQGFHQKKTPDFVNQLIEVFELTGELEKKTQELSKGALQRTILAFSLLYGSKILMLDEPVFALEPYQKQKAMEFLCDYARKNDMTILYSAHEMDVTEKYCDHIMLFYKDSKVEVGPPEEILIKEKIEAAYQVPMFMFSFKILTLFSILLMHTSGSQSSIKVISP